MIMTRFTYDNSEETRIKEIARLREKSLHDEASAIKNAKEEGKAEEKLSIIAKMKTLGMTEEQIKAIFPDNRVNPKFCVNEE